MYGSIGKLNVVSEKREELIEILLQGARDMSGCLSYIIARDPTDANAIWIAEVCDSQASHQASLLLPSVQQAIAQGRPLIASFGERIVTEPIGGSGISRPRN